jgi:hypothetical protein
MGAAAAAHPAGAAVRAKGTRCVLARHLRAQPYPPAPHPMPPHPPPLAPEAAAGLAFCRPRPLPAPLKGLLRALQRVVHVALGCCACCSVLGMLRCCKGCAPVMQMLRCVGAPQHPPHGRVGGATTTQTRPVTSPFWWQCICVFVFVRGVRMSRVLGVTRVAHVARILGVRPSWLRCASSTEARLPGAPQGRRLLPGATPQLPTPLHASLVPVRAAVRGVSAFLPRACAHLL